MYVSPVLLISNNGYTHRHISIVCALVCTVGDLECSECAILMINILISVLPM